MSSIDRAKNLAEEIESNLRKSNKTMGAKYQHEVVSYIKMLQSLTTVKKKNN